MSMENLVFKGESNQVLTNSLLVAEKFEKRHSDVIRSIENLLHTEDGELNAKMRLAFVTSTYVDLTGKSNPLYIMNRKGFSILVMGYTGVKALRFKNDFYDAFEMMENRLKETSNVLSADELILLMAQRNVENSRKIKVLEQENKEIKKKVEYIDAKTSTRPDYFSIVAFARICGLQIGLAQAKTLGKQATGVCNALHYDIDKVSDPRFGVVNTYPSSVLKNVFERAGYNIKILI